MNENFIDVSDEAIDRDFAIAAAELPKVETEAKPSSEKDSGSSEPGHEGEPVEGEYEGNVEADLKEILMVMFEAQVPEWKITEQECERLAYAYSLPIKKYGADNIFAFADRYAHLWMPVYATAMVILPRIRKAKLAEQQKDAGGDDEQAS